MNLGELIKNVNKARHRKDVFDRIGRSNKALVFHDAVTRLNELFGTSFYIERNGHEFTIQGHREYGHPSLRNGILNKNIGLTLGVHELKDAGTINTIKFVLDNKNNFILVSLSKMREYGCFSESALAGRFRILKTNTIPYCTWDLEELDHIGAILYRSIQN